MKKVIAGAVYYGQLWRRRPKVAAVTLFPPLIIWLPIAYFMAGWWFAAVGLVLGTILEVYTVYYLRDYPAYKV